MREIDMNVVDFTQEEIALLASNGVTGDEVREFLRTSGPQTLEAAIGGIQLLRSGQGQERNEPFQTQAEADAQVSE